MNATTSFTLKTMKMLSTCHNCIQKILVPIKIKRIRGWVEGEKCGGIVIEDKCKIFPVQVRRFTKSIEASENKNKFSGGPWNRLCSLMIILYYTFLFENI